MDVPNFFRFFLVRMVILMPQNKKNFWTAFPIVAAMVTILSFFGIRHWSQLIGAFTNNTPQIENGTQNTPMNQPPVVQPTDAEIRSRCEQEVRTLLEAAAQVEIRAKRTLDVSLLSEVYSAEALRLISEQIEMVKSQGFYYDAEIVERIIHSIKIESDYNHAQVSMTETWRTTTRNATTGAVVEEGQSKDVPQTVTLEKTGRGWMITAVTFDQN